MSSRVAWSLVLLAACTPPHVRAEDHPPAQVDTDESQQQGMAAGSVGNPIWATSGDMYKALGSLITGVAAQGRETYSLSVEEKARTAEQRRALDELRRSAASSTRDEARRDGVVLRHVSIEVRKLDADHFRVHVVTIVEEKGEPRHAEHREGTITRDEDGRLQLEWSGPPET